MARPRGRSLGSLFLAFRCLLEHPVGAAEVGASVLLLGVLKYNPGTPAHPSALPILPGRRRHAPFLALSLGIGDLDGRGGSWC